MERCCRGSSRGETDDSGPFQAPYNPGGWKSDNLVAFLGRGQQSQEPMGELKSLLGHRKEETYTMLLLVG